MKFTLIFLLLFFFCSKIPEKPEITILAEGEVLADSFFVEEIKTRARVKKERTPGSFSLEFSESAKLEILKSKPNRVLVKLPFVNAREIYVPLSYSRNDVSAKFQFPVGWIDSSELEVYYSVKGKKGYIVSPEAIYSPLGEETYVVKVIDGVSHHIPISILGIKNNRILISGELQAGDVLLKSRLSESVPMSQVKVKI